MVISNNTEHSSFHINLIDAALEVLGPGVTDLTADEILDREHIVEDNWVRMRRGIEARCRPCVHSALFGWWGYPLLRDLNAHTHCAGCHRSWRGVKEAHCTVCHEQFASNEAAAKHWVNDRHVDPSKVKGVNGKPRFCISDQESEFGTVWTLCRHLVEAS